MTTCVVIAESGHGGSVPAYRLLRWLNKAQAAGIHRIAVLPDGSDPVPAGPDARVLRR